MANVVLTFGSDNSPKADPADNVLYRDIDLDVQLNTKNCEQTNKDYDVYTVKQLIDINAVANSLNNIFTWTQGERVLDPEFGTNLRKVLFEGITAQNSELIRAEVRNAISKYEPRIQIQDIYDISTTDDTENNTVQMRIVYSVPTLPGQLFTYDYFALKR